MRWADFVACMGDRRGAYRVFVYDVMERDRVEDPGLDRKVILKGIFRKSDGEVWTGLLWLRVGTGGRYL
jgi:hypothetical protein